MPRLPGPGDLIGVLQTQAEALAALPATLAALNRSVRGLADTVGQARETVATVQRLATRMDGLLDELEEPVRALAPGLTRLAAVLDDPAVATLPETLLQAQADVLPVLRGLRDTQVKVAGIATTTDRLVSLVDAGGRLAGLPGAALLGLRRANAPDLAATADRLLGPEPPVLPPTPPGPPTPPVPTTPPVPES